MVRNQLQLQLNMMFRRTYQHCRILNLATTTRVPLMPRLLSSRTFTSLQTSDVMAETQSQETQSSLHESILRKQERGRRLAMEVTKSAPLDKMDRDRRYEVFINKMMALYSSKKRFQRKMNKSRKLMRGANYLFHAPVQAVLSEYSKLTNQGFNCELLANSLEDLNGVLQARGNKPKVYTDYETHEMDASWRMDKVAEDIIFGLTSKYAFFSPHNQGRVSRLLGEINYKNTDIIRTWLQSLLTTLESDQYAVRMTEPPKFDEVVYGGFQGFNPKYHVFQGFQTNEEFQDHLRTLMMYRAENSDSVVDREQETKGVLHALEKTMHAARELKDLQTGQHAAIESLRQQYFKLRDAQDKNEFLQQNKYIVYDMLELQELLVKGGYINPEEALEGLNESMESRMERASEVFYDYIATINPEVLSPQNQSMIKAQQERKVKNKNVAQNIEFETHNLLYLGTLSDILVGLSAQAQSQRRDARGNDYPTDFYEEILHPEEKMNGHFYASSAEHQQATKGKNPYVCMEQSYLNGWRDFSKLSHRIVTEHFTRLIENTRSAEDLLKSLNALSSCKFEARDMRDKIMEKLHKKITANQHIKIDSQAAIDGLQGIGNCAYVAPHTANVVEHLVQTMSGRKINFYQKVDLLNGIALCSSKAPHILKKPVVRQVIEELSELQYSAIDNDFNLKQFDKLTDVYKTLKFHGIPTFPNKVLDGALENGDVFRNAFDEAGAEGYDPIKQKVTAALVKSIHESDLAKVKAQHDFFEHVKTITLRPDIFTGYKGKHCAIYVLTARQMMRDTYTADGRHAHLMSLSRDVENVSVPVDRVVDYDLKKYTLNVREDFSLQKLLKHPQLNRHEAASKQFIDFVGKLTRSMDPRHYSGNMDQFVQQLAEYFRLKERFDMVHEPVQLISANNELKLALLKMSLLHEHTLTDAEKTIINSAVAGFATFHDMAEALKNEHNLNHRKFKKRLQEDELDKKFDYGWQGTRLSVEIPNNDPYFKKEIAPEMISAKFARHGSYHHYDDWKAMQKQCLDQFNLMEVAKEHEWKVNYDAMDFNRIVPKGIFPLPNRKRVVMEPADSLRPLPSGQDKFNKFEKDPMEYMIEQELEISRGLSEMTPEVSLITNLQNMKYGLLADCSDAEICEKLLKLDFVDKLIGQHLSQSASSQKVTHLPRDPAAFRKFHNSIPQPQTMYSQYWLKEAAKKKHIEELLAKVTQLQREDNHTKAAEVQKQLDMALLKEERENEDLWSLSSSLKQYITINVDIQSLGVLDRPMETHKNESISDEDFLTRERCLAESRLIKQKILYDLHEGNKLSTMQEKYLSAWKKAMSDPRTLMEECLVPATPSTSSIGELGTADINRLNSIPLVKLEKALHGDFALSELVVEMGVVLDKQIVRAAELTFLQETIKEDWELGNDFRLFQHRNKEIDNVVSKYEEIAYRAAGCFNKHDQESLRMMFSVGRGVDLIDRQYLEADLNSMNEFINNVNGYDNRIKLMELWLQRKENEINARIAEPTPSLTRTDMTINRELEKAYEPARRKLVSTISGADYATLSSDQLHILVEDLVTRMNMFQREYPVYLPHAVRAIFEHPNLARTDRATLDTYCKVFKLDWRFDQHINNKDMFMATNPIYLRKADKTTLDAHPITKQESAIAEIKKACKPYLPDLVQKIRRHFGQQ